jgi:hypothetical protein
MSNELSAGLVRLLDDCPSEHLGARRVSAEAVAALALRVRGEYEEMPGLRLTVMQAARLFGVAPDVARAVLDHLQRARVLRCSERGRYSLSR